MLRAVGYPGDMNFEPEGDHKHANALAAVAAAPERIAALRL